MTRKTRGRESFTPGDESVGGHADEQQRRLRDEARYAFLTQVPLLDSRAVGEMLGSRAKNPSAMASRLKQEGKLFAVRHRGVDLYPAFQFVDGRPLPAVAGVLEAFRKESDWTVALWFSAPSGWLVGRRPIDLVQGDPARVVDAANRTMDRSAF